MDQWIKGSRSSPQTAGPDRADATEPVPGPGHNDARVRGAVGQGICADRHRAGCGCREDEPGRQARPRPRAASRSHDRHQRPGQQRRAGRGQRLGPDAAQLGAALAGRALPGALSQEPRRLRHARPRGEHLSGDVRRRPRRGAQRIPPLRAALFEGRNPAGERVLVGHALRPRFQLRRQLDQPLCDRRPDPRPQVRHRRRIDPLHPERRAGRRQGP